VKFCKVTAGGACAFQTVNKPIVNPPEGNCVTDIRADFDYI
jgi:hypothetical protein